MNLILFMIRWALLSLLLWAACSVCKRISHLKACFSPIVTVSVIALTVYFGGLTGCLRPITYMIIVICTICLIYEINKIKKTLFVIKEFPIIEGLFLLGTLCFGLLLYHNTLVHYDNFTHWGLIVKEMLITHAFPTMDSVLIEFTNYPPGTAAWIYFVCTIVGNGENSMIMAQSIIIFASFYAIFGIIEERGRFLLIVILGTGLSLLSMFNLSIRINNLLVDFILPVLALAAISLIYRHRQTPNTLFITVTPILGLLVIIKSTGIIFASIPILYLIYITLLYFFRHNNKSLLLFGKLCCSIGLSLLPLLGWNYRMDTEFSGIQNKFETDLTLVSAGFGEKTQEEVLQICHLFWNTITDLTQRATIGILLFQFVAIIACIIGCGILKKKWALPKVLIAMDFVLIGYLLGILAMYIFSMPLEEAIYLAAFDRYSSSIIVLFGGVLAICFTIDIEHSFYYRLGEVDDVYAFKNVENKMLYLKSCVVCIIAISLVLTSEYNGMAYQTRIDQTNLSHTVKDIVGDNWSTDIDSSRYLLFASDSDGLVSNYYLHYVGKYYLRANHVDTICLFYEDNFLNLLSQYDYLVIIETSNQAQDLMQRYLGLSGQPGIYDLSNI